MKWYYYLLWVVYFVMTANKRNEYMYLKSNQDEIRRRAKAAGCSAYEMSLIPSEIEKRKGFISFSEFKEIYSKKSKGGVPC